MMSKRSHQQADSLKNNLTWSLEEAAGNNVQTAVCRQGRSLNIETAAMQPGAHRC